MTESTLKKRYESNRIINIFDRVDEYYRYLKEEESTLNANHEIYKEYKSYISYVNSLLQKLDPTHSFFLINCFYGNSKETKKWWKGQYTKSTFYRIRQEAIHAFLESYKPWQELKKY